MPCSAAIVTGTNENPRPTPASTKPGARSTRYAPSTDTCVSQAVPSASRKKPDSSTVRTPMRVTSACDAAAETMIVPAMSR